MLVGPQPGCLVLGEESGTYAANVYDFWRPFGLRAALVEGKYSVECYLDAVTGAFGAYRALEHPPLGRHEVLTDRLAGLLFHAPFPKMVAKAHRRLLEVDLRAAGDRWRAVEAVLEDVVGASFRAQVAPGLEAVARIGNTYTASLYLCLAALLESHAGGLAGRRLGLFSYGSGCGAEFFTGLVPDGAAAVASAGVAELLDRRSFVEVSEYEDLVSHEEAGGEPPADFDGEFVFRGTERHRRRYERVKGTRRARGADRPRTVTEVEWAAS
jgi:hydroxymethylglutaryl-CoA synthase